MLFRATLVDLQDNWKKLDCFLFSAVSPQEALNIAYEELQDRPIFQEDHDVRELVRIHKLGEAFTAGNEFDVLPEALRRLALTVSR